MLITTFTNFIHYIGDDTSPTQENLIYTSPMTFFSEKQYRLLSMGLPFTVWLWVSCLSFLCPISFIYKIIIKLKPTSEGDCEDCKKEYT